MHFDEIADAIDDLLSSTSPRSETQGIDHRLWDVVTSAGFDRALAPVSLGGSGLALREVRGIFEACGRYASPIPLGEAILARGMAGQTGVDLPQGIVTLALAEYVDGRLRAHSVPWARGSDWVMTIVPGAQAYLFASTSGSLEESPGLGACGESNGTWHVADATRVISLLPGVDGLVAGAALRCAQIAGALGTVLQLSQDYVVERRQFGRALADFQAIQQQTAVLAEDCFAAQMAAEIACDSAGVLPLGWNVSVAKVVASEAAARACSIAHAVHGAMGMTAESRLHFYTRRLRAWRAQFGSEHYWGRCLGGALLATGATAWEFVIGS
jgi:acyl-CoA dehydrogenase